MLFDNCWIVLGSFLLFLSLLCIFFFAAILELKYKLPTKIKFKRIISRFKAQINKVMNYIKVHIGALPYQLAFRKFKLINGISLTRISFAEESKIQQYFDKMYGF